MPEQRDRRGRDRGSCAALGPQLGLEPLLAGHQVVAFAFSPAVVSILRA